MGKSARIVGEFPTRPEKSGKFAILVGGFPTAELSKARISDGWLRRTFISQGPNQTVVYLKGSNHLFSQQPEDFPLVVNSIRLRRMASKQEYINLWFLL